MRYQENFKFLNVQVMKRKSTQDNQKESEFLLLNLLDDENNPCKFFVFNKDLIDKIYQNQYVGLQDILIDFALIFANNNWTVRLLDVN